MQEKKYFLKNFESQNGIWLLTRLGRVEKSLEKIEETAPKPLQEYRNRSENIMNEKIMNFCIEAIPKKISTPTEKKIRTEKKNSEKKILREKISKYF